MCTVYISSNIQHNPPPPGATQPIVGVYFTALYRALAYSRTRLLDHTQRRVTVGRTPLNEWSVRRRDLYLTTYNTHNKHPCPGWDSNPRSQQACGRRPTPYTAQLLGPAYNINRWWKLHEGRTKGWAIRGAARGANQKGALRHHWNNRKYAAGKLRFPCAGESLRKLYAIRARAVKMFTCPVLGRKKF